MFTNIQVQRQIISQAEYGNYPIGSAIRYLVDWQCNTKILIHSPIHCQLQSEHKLVLFQFFVGGVGGVGTYKSVQIWGGRAETAGGEYEGGMLGQPVKWGSASPS